MVLGLIMVVVVVRVVVVCNGCEGCRSRATAGERCRLGGGDCHESRVVAIC